FRGLSLWWLRLCLRSWNFLRKFWQIRLSGFSRLYCRFLNWIRLCFLFWLRLGLYFRCRNGLGLRRWRRLWFRFWFYLRRLHRFGLSFRLFRSFDRLGFIVGPRRRLCVDGLITNIFRIRHVIRLCRRFRSCLFTYRSSFIALLNLRDRFNRHDIDGE